MKAPRSVSAVDQARRSRRTALQAASRADTPEHLLAFQRTLQDALIRPLGAGNRTQRQWTDGTPMAEFAATFIKSNDRLTALDRLQIYHRMYWFRLIDSFHDDNPGLRAVLGRRRFNQLAEAYLTRHPSSSFTLRNLCAKLEGFLGTNRRLTAPHTLLALDVARFEWAQTVAFDEAARPGLSPAEFAGTPPARLRLGVQPYVTLLALQHPVDDYVIAVKQREALRDQASNATMVRHTATRQKSIPRPPRQRIYLAVHRLNQRLYYKRLEPAAYRILTALCDGLPLARAVTAGGSKVTAEHVREWFATWMQLGWFCVRS